MVQWNNYARGYIINDVSVSYVRTFDSGDATRLIYSSAPMARVKAFTIRAGYTAAGLNDSPGDILDNRQHVRGRV